MNICNVNFAFYVVWTPKGIHIEEVKRDQRIFYQEMIPKFEKYFTEIILPELTKKADV